MDITLLSTVATYLVFGWVGYVWAKRMPLPARFVDWFLWLIAFLLAGSIRLGDLVNIFGFVIRSEDLLQALVVGILINFILRLTRAEPLQTKTKV